MLIKGGAKKSPEVRSKGTEKLIKIRRQEVAGRSHLLKEINPEYSLGGLMLKLNTLATWCEELTHWKRP